MTQPALDFSPALQPSFDSGIALTPADQVRLTGQTLCDRLEAYFRARPGHPIDARVLLTIAGFAGWRTRVSELRTERGMRIDNTWSNREDHGRKYRVSVYTYVPEGK